MNNHFLTYVVACALILLSLLIVNSCGLEVFEFVPFMGSLLNPYLPEGLGQFLGAVILTSVTLIVLVLVFCLVMLFANVLKRPNKEKVE
jgi:hypothetical protein